MWASLARDIDTQLDPASAYVLPLSERRYLARSVFCGRLWHLAQVAITPPRIVRQGKSSLLSFIWTRKTELVARPVLSFPRERGGWSFPCVDIASAVLQLKTMMKILREEHNPARSLALFFVGHSRRDLGVEVLGPPGACAETPPQNYRRGVQRLEGQAPQVDVVDIPTARLTEVLLGPEISTSQAGLGDSFPWALGPPCFLLAPWAPARL
ncbi:unnamed protein product [Ixodes hexagonus]